MTGHLDPDRFYWASEVAENVFGRSIDWFYTHRRKLHDEDGFPQPISRIGRPRWKGRVLIEWSNRLADQPPPAPDPHHTGPHTDWSAHLAARTRALFPNN